MSTPGSQVVLGATGGAGNAIARALHDAGIPVRAVNRSGSADLPEGIELAAADVTDPGQLAHAVAGAAVVYMAAQPAYDRWADEFPAMLEGVIGACGAIDAKLVMVDNLYAYGPGHDRLTEDAAHRATDTKGTVRRRMHRRLVEAHERGEVSVAIGQASDYFGPSAGNSAVTALALEPVAGSGTLRWPGSLDAPHSIAYLPDIARAYVTLGESDEAAGRTWILPHGDPVTGREFLDAVNRSLETPRRTGRISTLMLRLASPFHSESREMLGVAYQWTEPWVADDTAFQEAFGPFETTPLEEAIARTVAYYANRST